MKVIVLERLRVMSEVGTRLHQWDGSVGALQYRIGYYTIGGYGRGVGRWLWGQFSPLIPQEDLMALLAKARAEGTMLEPD